MTDQPTTADTDHLTYVSGIVAAYVSNPNNKIGADAVPGLIAAASAALKGLGAPPPEPAGPVVERPSRQAIGKSISDAGIRSFLDGKVYQSLKRHLATRGHTPESYREAYGLPKDYPIVSPAYSARRSAVAKALGLGVKSRTAKAASAPEPVKPKKRTKAAPDAT